MPIIIRKMKLNRKIIAGLLLLLASGCAATGLEGKAETKAVVERQYEPVIAKPDKEDHKYLNPAGALYKIGIFR